jgi:hypothetical protein
MPTQIDPLSLAGDASAALERHGFVACGRRVNGETRIDFWTRDGAAYRLELKGDERSVDEVVATCRALAAASARPSGRSSDLS